MGRKMMRISDNVEAIMKAAYDEAKGRSHEYLTPEHILYVALSYEEVQSILSACGANPGDVRSGMEEYLEKKVPRVTEKEPLQTVTFQRVIERAAFSSQSAQKTVVEVSDLLVSLFDEEKNHCGHCLRKAGVSRSSLLKVISHGSQENPFSDMFFGAEDRQRGRNGKKTALDRFAVDLTAMAREGRLEPVIGREAELERTIQVLCRRLKNNPVHVGDAGVGKTAVTEGLAQRIVSGDVPPQLKDASVYSLDMGAVLAGTRYRGDFEERIKRVMDELAREEKAILFIDEIHTMVGAGSASGSAMDASNLLKPALASGKLRCIGSTTHEEYNRYFERDRALSRRFQKIDIEEPSEADAITILKGLKGKYEEFHRVRYEDAALEAAVKLSAQFITERKLPDKAIDVIDEAGAYARIGAYKQKTALDGVAAAVDAAPEEEKDGDEGPVTVGVTLIEKVVSRIARMPEKSVGHSEKDKLQSLEEDLRGSVFGQDDAVKAVVKAVKRSRAGFRGENKPVASFLFVGPTGVGKTELAKQLAETLGITLHRFDMSEYQEPHTVSRLIGSPPGYVDHNEGGLLTSVVRKQPNAVVLLDEIEKAHPDIYNILLQIMDYATLTDNAGRQADFRNVVLIMTSNAGARDIGRSYLGFGERVRDDSVVNDAVTKIFTPEFRNRLDAVIRFGHLSKEIVASIVIKELDQFKKQLKEKNVTMEVTDACVARLAEDGYSREFGARNVSRVVEDKIKAFFVDEVLFGSLSAGGAAKADYADGDYRITVIK